MTLRTRLFLFFGALIAVLASAELWLVRSLARDLETEAQGLALSVGSSFVQAFSGAIPVPGALEDCELGFEVHALHHDGPTPLLDFDFADEALGESIAVYGKRSHTLFRSGTVPWPKGDPPPFLAGEPIELGSGRRLALRIEAGTDPSSGEIDGIAKEMVLRILERDRADDESMATGEGPSARAPLPSADTGTMLSVPLERPGLRMAMERFRSRLILGSAAILGLGLLIAGFVAHRVSEPLRQLSHAARAVGEGDFGVQVPATGDEEVRGTLQAFNAMSLRLAELNAEADRLREGKHLSELGDIARGLAHSLRNPLHVLGLSVDRLAIGAEPGLGQAARAHIERIDRTLRSLLVLSSSSPEDTADVDLADVARDVALELLQDPSRSHPTEVEAEAPAIVRGVPAEVRAVVHVLMINAAEASPEGSPILVRVEPQGDSVELTVTDEGPGLDPQVRASLFKPHSTSKPQGAGMGLYLAQRIASNRYGGSLSLEERAEGGTTARLRLTARSGAA